MANPTIKSGYIWSSGDEITAARLNSMVDDAILSSLNNSNLTGMRFVRTSFPGDEQTGDITTRGDDSDNNSNYALVRFQVYNGSDYEDATSTVLLTNKSGEDLQAGVPVELNADGDGFVVATEESDRVFGTTRTRKDLASDEIKNNAEGLIQLKGVAGSRLGSKGVIWNTSTATLVAGELLKVGPDGSYKGPFGLGDVNTCAIALTAIAPESTARGWVKFTRG